MSKDNATQDPLDFVRNMWNNMGFSLPGMVAPTLDIDELDKRIHDMKAVEHWLKMNLNMLQMTTQGLEMQRAALAAVKAMSAHASEHSAAADEPAQGEPNPFASAAMWPWNFMNAQSPKPGETDAKPATDGSPEGDKAPTKTKPKAATRKPASDSK